MADACLQRRASPRRSQAHRLGSGARCWSVPGREVCAHDGDGHAGRVAELRHLAAQHLGAGHHLPVTALAWCRPGRCRARPVRRHGHPIVGRLGAAECERTVSGSAAVRLLGECRGGSNDTWAACISDALSRLLHRPRKTRRTGKPRRNDGSTGVSGRFARSSGRSPPPATQPQMTCSLDGSTGCHVPQIRPAGPRIRPAPSDLADGTEIADSRFP